MVKHNLVGFFCLVLLLSSCLKREAPLTWDSDWSIPLAQGSLNLSDLLPDSVLVSNGDSSLQLVIDAELFRLDVEELVALPDTTMYDEFSLPFITTVSFNPGQVFINQPEDNKLNIDDAELTMVKIASGKLLYSLESTIAGDVIYTYKIPAALNELGAPFEASVLVPAGTQTNRSVVTGQLDLSGYTINLTGLSGNAFNTVTTSIDCKIDPNYANPVGVSNQDTIFIANTLQGVKIQRAEGYFGNHQINTGLEYTDVEGFNIFQSGSIAIDDFDVNFFIENGIGVDALIGINAISSIGVNGAVTNLNNAIIGSTQQVNRAYESNGAFVSSLLSFYLNQNNSNLDQMIQDLPSAIGYDLDVEINPLGNISGYNDFIDRDSPLRFFINASMPLSFIASDLVLVDTIEINLADTSMLNTMKLMIEAKNGFPLGAEISMAVLDQNDKITNYIFSPNILQPANLGSDGKVSESVMSYHEIELIGKDLERLKQFGKVILTVKFDSGDNLNPVKIYDYYSLDYDIKANANVKITIGN